MSVLENYDDLATTPAASVALGCLAAGIRAARPDRVVQRQVRVDGETLLIESVEGTVATYDLDAYDEIIVVGGGNAAGHVAAALEEVLGDRITDGLVVTDDPRPTNVVETIEGTHPIPSDANVAGTRRLLDRVENAGAETLILAAITGGGSALLAAPEGPVDLDALQAVTEELLRAGLPIDRINAVRKHLSAIKGGGLADRAQPATVAGLLFSDVIGDDPSVIASGPTAPDATTFEEARTVLDRADIEPPATVDAHLEKGLAGEIQETIDPETFANQACQNYVLANGHTALAAARQTARTAGLDALVLSGSIRGEASAAGAFHVAVAEECSAHGEPLSPPGVILSGGETTVEVAGSGRGGPNLEFALAAGLELPADGSVTVASVDTDGIDGNTPVAGGLVSGATAGERSAGQDALARNDAYGYLSEHGAVVRTGQTGTNVNDLRVVVLSEPRGQFPSAIDHKAAIVREQSQAE